MDSPLAHRRLKDHMVEVIDATNLTSWYRRLTMNAEGLFETHIPDPGAYLNLNIPVGASTLPRSYTIRGATPTTFLLEFVLHTPSGPGCEWAAAAGPGTTVTVTEPPYTLEIPDVSRALIIADPSALAGASSILESIEKKMRVTVLLEDNHPDRDQIPIPTTGNIVWLDMIDDDVLELATAHLDAQDCFLWAAGERRLAKLVREFARTEFRVPRQAQHIQTYWISQGRQG